METHPLLTSEIEIPEADFFFKSLPILLSESNDEAFVPTDFRPEPFIQLLFRHRMVPQFYEWIKNSDINMPPRVLSGLKKKQVRITSRSLLLSSEIIKVSRLLKEAGVPVLFLKGPVLANMLYGYNTIRQSIDIDVFVDKKNLSAARGILEKTGYAPGGNGGKLKTALAGYSRKDHLFVHTKNGVQLELHHRYFYNPYLNDLFCNNQPSTIYFDFKGSSIPTLSAEWHFLYLIAHGTLHQYFRLFWLYDVAAFICSDKIGDWKQVEQLAEKTGLLVHLYLSLQLVQVFFGFQHPDFVVRSSTMYKTAEKLIPEVAKAISNPVDETIKRRIQRLMFFLRLNKNVVYRWHTIQGGVLRFLE